MENLPSEKLMSELLRVIGDINDIKPTGSGRNHLCYAVVSGRKKFFLKIFRSSIGGAKERYEREVEGGKFVARQGIRTPQHIASAVIHTPWVLYEYINETAHAVLNVSDFLNFLKVTNDNDNPADFHLLALGNGLKVSEVWTDIQKRLGQLKKEIIRHPSLERSTRLIESHASHIIEKTANYIPMKIVFSAGDFGIHNSLSTKDGLYFIDFEYCGQDDLAKVLSDFLLNPSNSVLKPYFPSFIEAALEHFNVMDLYAMENLFELYKIRWSLILLNDFRREYSHRIENLDENARIQHLETKLESSRAILGRNLLH